MSKWNNFVTKMFLVARQNVFQGKLVARESQWGVERDWASRQSLSYFYHDRSMTSKSYLRHIFINLVQLKIWKVIFSLVQAHQSSSHFYSDYHGRIWYKRANTAWHILISWRKGDFLIFILARRGEDMFPQSCESSFHSPLFYIYSGFLFAVTGSENTKREWEFLHFL